MNCIGVSLIISNYSLTCYVHPSRDDLYALFPEDRSSQVVFPASSYLLASSPLPKFWEGEIKRGWVSSYYNKVTQRLDGR